MPTAGGLLNTFFGAGFTSALVYYVASDIDPLIAAIIWTLPFTMIFPVYNMHKNKKSNAFISNYLKTQTFTMILLLVFLFATAHFVAKAPKEAGIIIPLLKGGAIWLIAGILYYLIARNLAN